jgi:molecular chaperone DnaK (HSP70)
MSYQVGLDLGSAGTTVATDRGVTTSSHTRNHARNHRPHAPAKELAKALDDLAQRHGEPPSKVAMTHPLTWGHEYLEQLRADLIDEGRADVLFVPAPHAAAIAFDANAQMPEHSTVAVFDFGATGCDITVLRKQGVFLVAGRPERVDIGGFDLDDLVAEHVQAKIGTSSPELRTSCAEAKELLGSYPEVRIPVVDVEIREVRLSRLEFEAIIRPSIALTVDALERVADSAGLCLPDVILLVGGSARIPLVAKEISDRLRIPVLRAPDGATAMGALLEAKQLEPEPAEEPTVWIPAPRDESKPKRRIPTTPFVTAGLLALVITGGWAAHEAMNRPQVVMETTSVELAPPGVALLPRM